MAIQYFGNRGIIDMTNQFITRYGQKDEKRAFMYVGAPGVGKTYLTAYIAEKYNVERVLINASDEKTQDSVASILQTVKSKKGTRLIVVLDECEAMSTKNLDRIIKATNVPLFLCCNFIDMVDIEITSQCVIGKIEIPQWWTFKEYMVMVMNRIGMPIPSDIDEIAKCARSFRHAERLVDDPTDIAPEPIETPYSEVEKLFRGVQLDHISMQPKELVNWVHDNANIPELASKIDTLLEHAFLDDYHHWAYAYSLLKTVRCDKKVEYPRSFAIMAKLKKEVNESKRADRDAALSNVKVDFSKVDVTAVKSGASLFAGLDDLDLDSLK